MLDSHWERQKALAQDPSAARIRALQYRRWIAHQTHPFSHPEPRHSLNVLDDIRDTLSRGWPRMFEGRRVMGEK